MTNEQLEEKLRIAKEALLSIKAVASVSENNMYKQDIGDYWRMIAHERQYIAMRALDRLERLPLSYPQPFSATDK